MRTRTALAAVVLGAAALAACGTDGGPAAAPSPTASTPTGPPPPTAAVTSPPPKPKPTTKPTVAVTRLPAGLRSQAPIQGCVNGWKEPAPNTALRTAPLDWLRREQGFTKAFQVVDLRYFVGPDDANLSPGSRRPSVERWYGKVVYTGDPSFKVRFLARRTPVGEGIVAVAPYGTKNFASGDWTGFEGDGGPSTFPGLPGKWHGVPTDYTAEGALPPEVTGCLAE